MKDHAEPMNKPMNGPVNDAGFDDMSLAGADWTDAELELFHDGEMNIAEARALSEALRVRPELRARLAEIARADGVTVAAMTAMAAAVGESEAAGGAGAEGVGREADQAIGVVARIGLRPWAWAAAAAAVLIIAGGLMMMSRVGRGSARGGAGVKPNPSVAMDTDASRARSNGVGATNGEYRAVRVVFSLPLREEAGAWSRASVETRPDPEEELASAKSLSTAESDAFVKRLDTALAAGRVDEALAMVRGAGPTDRARAYARFGGAVRSSASALEVMDGLEPEEQVAACKQWIAAGSQRRFAMDRLRMLGRRAELEEPVRIAVRELLADDPSLRAWVMSYVPWAVEGAGKRDARQG